MCARSVRFVLAALAVLVVAGCSTTTPSPSPSAVTHGQVFGHPLSVDGGGALTVGLGELFTDDAANSAAAEDGKIASGETLPSPVYIRDLGRHASITIDPKAAVTILPDGFTPTQVDGTAFAAAMKACLSNETCGWFWFTLDGGTATAVVQELLP